MGTRSVVSFFDRSTPVAGVYRQYDGYLVGRGLELSNFLNARKITNGFTLGQTAMQFANGAGDLAAQWIATEKRDSHGELQIGNVYMQEPLSGPSAHDYTYRVDVDGFAVRVTAWRWDKEVFSGTAAEFAEFIEKDAKAAA